MIEAPYLAYGHDDVYIKALQVLVKRKTMGTTVLSIACHSYNSRPGCAEACLIYLMTGRTPFLSIRLRWLESGQGKTEHG
jgi:hypothetical protein